MSRPRLTPALLAVLALTACTDGSTLTAPTGTGTRDVPGGTHDPSFPGGTSGGTDTTGTGGTDTTGTGPIDTVAAGDPVNNGTWTLPGDSMAVIQPVDPGTYDPTGSGTAGTSGSSTAVVFNTSGSGQYGIGTCGPNGYWTDPDGNVFGPNNPNCISYGSDGGTGNNGKGQCVTSPDGQPGLWINPGGHATNPYHSQCARVGATITTLALTFPMQAQVFDANDGSGSRALNFYSAGTAVAQLLYDGATNTTTGAGILVGSDNASPANSWTIFFGQSALNYLGGFANGDLIDALASSAGLEVVACSTPLGCSLVTLQLTLAP
jgi:hypothetical protein